MAEATREPFGIIKIRVAGVAVSVDVFEDLGIKDVNKDITQVSAQMAFWGDVQASAQEELTAHDAHYRHWRANASTAILKREEKIAEWKIKAEIEASPTFLAMKVRQAQLEKNLLIARSQFASYDKKANLLQSKGANMRANIEAPSTLPATDYVPEPDEDVDEDVELEDEVESSVLGDKLNKMKSVGIFKKGKK